MTALTSFAEIAPAEKVLVNQETSPPFAEADAGYTSIGVPPALKFNFNVDSFAWTYGDQIGTVLRTIEFPTVLKSIPNIALKLAEHRYMSADVSVKVKVTSTPFHYGSLGLAYIPRITATGTGRYNNPLQLQSNPYVSFLDVGATETVDLKLERVPFSTFDYVATNGPTIGTLVIFCRTPLRSSGIGDEPSPLTVSTFANFENIKLAGYGESESVMAAMKTVVKTMRGPRKQSGVSQRSPEKEAQAKSEAGVVSSILAAASSATPLLAVSPLAEFAPLTMAAGALAPVFKSLGLSKPLSSKVQEPTYSAQRRYMSQGTGLAIHERLGNHQDASSPDIKLCGLSRPDIRDLAKTPAWLGTFSFDETFPREAVLRIIPLLSSLCASKDVSGTTTYAPGMMAYYSQFFKYWRGSLKIMLVFNCSLFTSATVRITHNTYNEATTDMELSAGNKISEILEIRGTTKWKKALPYIGLRAWTPVVGFRPPSIAATIIDAFPSALEITVLNPATSTADAGDATIYCSMYVAAGDDFDLKDYIGFNLRQTAVETPPPEKQSLAKDFSESFVPMHPALKAMEQGYVKSECETNLVELGHREVPVSDIAAMNAPLKPWLFFSTNQNHNERLLYPFLAFRGSTNIRMCANASIPHSAYLKSDQTVPPYYTSAWMDDKFWLTYPPIYVHGDPLPGTPGDLCVNVPHQAATPVVCAWSSLPEDELSYQPQLIYNGSNPEIAVYSSLGDDFTVGTPLNPPTFAITIPVPKPMSVSQLLTSPTIERGSNTAPAVSSSGLPPPRR